MIIAPCNPPDPGKEVEYALFYVDHFINHETVSARTLEYVAIILAYEVTRLRLSVPITP